MVYTIGLDAHYIGTFDHCVEALLYKDYEYWGQFFTLQKTYKYYDNDGTIKDYTCIEGDLERRTREQRLINILHLKCIAKKEFPIFL